MLSGTIQKRSSQLFPSHDHHYHVHYYSVERWWRLVRVRTNFNFRRNFPKASPDNTSIQVMGKTNDWTYTAYIGGHAWSSAMYIFTWQRNGHGRAVSIVRSYCVLPSCRLMFQQFCVVHLIYDLPCKMEHIYILPFLYDQISVDHILKEIIYRQQA